MSDDERERAIANAWVQNADAWTEAVRARRIESRRAVTDRAVVDAVLEAAPARVLDVGCGEGWLARALAAGGADVVGFDGSEALVERARQAGGARFHVLSYQAFQADPGRIGREFDVAVCNFALLGPEVVGPLRGIGAVLGGDGRLVVQTVHPWAAAEAEPYEDGWREEAFADLGPGFRTSMPWYFRTLATWVRELGEAGFVLVAVREPRWPASGRPASLILVARGAERP